ncbi:MAG: TlyA family RNA methyltransferase [Pseudomonadota bacterium]
MRADQLIVLRGLAPTRSAAQRLIDAGGVFWRGPQGWAVPRKAGEDLPDTCELQVRDDAELRFVSRGGLKLEAALEHCGVAVQGLQCLDVGQSTGGFTDALLQRGAARVVGIDVGHGQLNVQLRGDERVVCHEGVNARDVTGTAFGEETPLHSMDLVTGDVSFISLTLVLPTVVRYLAPQGHLLMLVKPQFELQPEHIGKNGLVKDPAFYAQVETRLRKAVAELSLTCRAYFPSTIQGGGTGHGAGNTEFFIWAQLAATPSSSLSPSSASQSTP